MSFAKELTEPAYAAHAGLDSRDARALAREFLTMSQSEFSARCKGSAMKRAKRRGLARNAAVVPGNVGTSEDLPLLEAARTHDERRVREPLEPTDSVHAAPTPPPPFDDGRRSVGRRRLSTLPWQSSVTECHRARYNPACRRCPQGRVAVFRFARRVPNRAEHRQRRRLARSIIASTADRI